MKFIDMAKNRWRARGPLIGGAIVAGLLILLAVQAYGCSCGTLPGDYDFDITSPSDPCPGDTITVSVYHRHYYWVSGWPSCAMGYSDSLVGSYTTQAGAEYYHEGCDDNNNNNNWNNWNNWWNCIGDDCQCKEDGGGAPAAP